MEGDILSLTLLVPVQGRVDLAVRAARVDWASQKRRSMDRMRQARQMKQQWKLHASA